MKLQIPIREGLFKDIDGEATLIGSKCKSCGAIFFPPKNFCLNCSSKEIEPFFLGGKGVLYSFTIVHMPAEHYEAPYAIGWIQFPIGVLVFAQIKNWEQTELKIGMGMKLVIGKLWEEEEREVIGYFFYPEEDNSSQSNLKES